MNMRQRERGERERERESQQSASESVGKYTMGVLLCGAYRRHLITSMDLEGMDNVSG